MAKKTKKIGLKKSALIIVDVQNDFCPGGALAVLHGDGVIVPLNNTAKHARKNEWLILASRDWHPYKTSHFKLFGGLWPVHCVKRTKGAEFHPKLKLPDGTVIASKGVEMNEDAYSVFDSVDLEIGVIRLRKEITEYMHGFDINTLYVGGLATDYCVKATVLDALKLGFKVYLLEDACRAVNLKPTDEADAIKEMIEAGKKASRGKFKITTTKEVLGK